MELHGVGAGVDGAGVVGSSVGDAVEGASVVGSCVGDAVEGGGVGAGVGVNVETETESTDADDIERRRAPSMVAKCTIAVVKLPSETAAFSASVTYSYTEPWPPRAATTSGTVTSFATTTELAAASVHTASENVAFAMSESSARSKTVPLKSAHAMPETPTCMLTIGVRVGDRVGDGVGTSVVGLEVGNCVGFLVGAQDGASVEVDPYEPPYAPPYVPPYALEAESSLELEPESSFEPDPQPSSLPVVRVLVGSLVGEGVVELPMLPDPLPTPLPGLHVHVGLLVGKGVLELP